MPSSIPVTPDKFGVSYTKLASFRRCRQQYHWKYQRKIYPPSGMGQIRGLAGHAALAEWHRSYDKEAAMQAAENTWQMYIADLNDDFQLLAVSLGRYFEWSSQNDSFILQESETKFDITYVLGDTQVTFTGYIDGIVKENNQLWLLENKFYKRMDNSPLDMDHQASLYMLASHRLDYQVQGVIYNIIRVADTKVAVTEPVVRRKLYRNPLGLEHIERELLQQVADMLKFQEGGAVYRNPTKDCHWDCPFYAACLLMTDDGLEPTTMLESINQPRSAQNAEEETTNG